MGRVPEKTEEGNLWFEKNGHDAEEFIRFYVYESIHLFNELIQYESIHLLSEP